MESLVKEYDEKQIQKKKDIEEENRKRRTPAGKANIHQIPQNKPTEALYKDKPVTEQPKSSSYLTTGNLVAGLGAVGTVAGVAYNVVGKTKQQLITPSNSDEDLKNIVDKKFKQLEKEGTIKALKKSYKEHDRKQMSGGGIRTDDRGAL